MNEESSSEESPKTDENICTADATGRGRGGAEGGWRDGSQRGTNEGRKAALVSCRSDEVRNWRTRDFQWNDREQTRTLNVSRADHSNNWRQPDVHSHNNDRTWNFGKMERKKKRPNCQTSYSGSGASRKEFRYRDNFQGREDWRSNNRFTDADDTEYRQPKDVPWSDERRPCVVFRKENPREKRPRVTNVQQEKLMNV